MNFLGFAAFVAILGLPLFLFLLADLYENRDFYSLKTQKWLARLILVIGVVMLFACFCICFTTPIVPQEVWSHQTRLVFAFFVALGLFYYLLTWDVLPILRGKRVSD